MKRDFGIKKIELKRSDAGIENKTSSVTSVSGDKKQSMARKKTNLIKRIGSIGAVLVVLIIILIVFVGIPLQKTYEQGLKTVAVAKEAVAFAKAQQLPQTSDKLKEVEKELLLLQEKYNKTIFLSYIPFLGSYVSDGKHGITAAIEIVRAGQISVDGIIPYSDLLGFTQGSTSFVNQSADKRIETAVKTLDKLTPQLSKIDEHLTIVQKEIAQIDPNRYPSKIGSTEIRSQIKTIKQVATEGITMFINARPLVEMLPKLLGEPNAKRYLILFQNDKELRATGGFITAYAVFRVDKGKLIVEKSEDIYNLDNRQKKRIAAPEEILTYHKGVYYANLRDSNTSPDFYESMQKFEALLANVTDAPDYDGIIAVDTHVLVSAINVLDGEIYVPEYNTKFTTQPDPRCDGCPQVVYELEEYADKPVGYSRGERKDILGRLMLSLMQKALGVSPGKYWGNLVQTFLGEMSQKHIIAYMKDDAAQSAFEALNFAGRINSVDGDYIHINDTNFAGAKSNLFVKHFVKQEITVGKDGKVTKTVTIDYKNPSKPSNCNLESGGLCLNGLLRNWLRVYVPKGSILREFTGASEEGIKTKTSEDLGKTVFEGFLTVRPLGSTQVVVKYELPNPVTGDYSLFIQKQPGTEGHEYTTVINGREKDTFNLITDKQFLYKL